MLTVLRHSHRVGTHYYSVARCDCGTEVTVRTDGAKSGDVRSCGCALKERKNHLTHGKTDTPEWRAWANMNRRCRTPSATLFHYYGGRGIRVCAEWQRSFQAFFDYMGSRPSRRHSIDRIDVNGHYEPGNVRWATPSVQMRNRRRSTRCRRGHAYTTANTRIRPDGRRACRSCVRYVEKRKRGTLT